MPFPHFQAKLYSKTVSLTVPVKVSHLSDYPIPTYADWAVVARKKNL